MDIRENISDVQTLLIASKHWAGPFDTPLITCERVECTGAPRDPTHRVFAYVRGAHFS